MMNLVVVLALLQDALSNVIVMHHTEKRLQGTMGSKKAELRWKGNFKPLVKRATKKPATGFSGAVKSKIYQTNKERIKKEFKCETNWQKQTTAFIKSINKNQENHLMMLVKL